MTAASHTAPAYSLLFGTKQVFLLLFFSSRGKEGRNDQRCHGDTDLFDDTDPRIKRKEKRKEKALGTDRPHAGSWVGRAPRRGGGPVN